MARDGYLVNGQCVVSSDGEAAADLALSHLPNHVVYNVGATSQSYTPCFDCGSPAGYTVTVNASSLEVDYPMWNDLTGGVAVGFQSMPACDSSIFPPANSVMFPFAPDISTAILLTIAIWGVWTVGFGIRALIKTLHHADNDDSSE